LDDKDISEKVKSLDFSSYSADHKEQLWKTLSKKNDRRVLLEHELNVAAAGIQEYRKESYIMSENKKTNENAAEADENTNEVKNETLEDVAGGLLVQPLSNCSKCGSRRANGICPRGCK
jgi:hypothetical protein